MAGVAGPLSLPLTNQARVEPNTPFSEKLESKKSPFSRVKWKLNCRVSNGPEVVTEWKFKNV